MRNIAELNINEGGRPVFRPPPSPQQLGEFERTFQVKLPQAYIELLGVANGGHPELDSFLVGHDPNDRWAISFFFHLSDDQSGTESVWRATCEHQPFLGPSTVPIARDGLGNIVYLETNQNAAPVWLWIHDRGPTRVMVASSLVEFIGVLERDPDAI